MIRRLKIQNYALIDKLDITFDSGFSVITGETGAGKSILLGAIGLLLGQRADVKSIKNDAQRCLIEAEFNLSQYNISDFFKENDFDFDGSECILRREITSAGKSRAFINDTPASVSQLKELGSLLIDIHSQHQNLLLSREHFQLEILDITANNQKLRQEYATAFRNWKQTKQTLEELKQQQASNQEELDYLQYQYDQLNDANLTPAEDEELEAEQSRLEHAEEIKSALYQTSNILDGDGNSLISAITEAIRNVRNITRVYTQAEELVERLDACKIELKDIASETNDKAEQTEYDPERLSMINERLSLIYQLEQKHHVSSVNELIVIKQQIEEKLEGINGSDERIEALQHTLQEQEGLLKTLASQLTETRNQASEQATKELIKRLSNLGMPNVQFAVELSPTANYELSGHDHACFMFSANKGGTPQPIQSVASGGEIARVMLSLKAMISSKMDLPTIIFDEIDTGVSGQMAEKMAELMSEMATNGRQVISITHLPQIAALGTSHYKVYKSDDNDTTTSHIVQLNDEERIVELAHMLSGNTITTAAMDNARALLRAQEK